MSELLKVEPWLRGTLGEMDSVRRQVLHALELAGEDAERWCGSLTDADVNARPFGMAPVAFHLRHMARSLDRLLTYAEGKQLTPGQMAALHGELEPGVRVEACLEEFRVGLWSASRRVAALKPGTSRRTRGGAAGPAEHGWRPSGALRGAHAEALGADDHDLQGGDGDAGSGQAGGGEVEAFSGGVALCGVIQGQRFGKSFLLKM